MIKTERCKAREDRDPSAVPEAKPVTAERINVRSAVKTPADSAGLSFGLRAMIDQYVAVRLQNHVMPWFSKSLCYTAECQ